jgi:SAM-dependent methyltransferase
MNWRLKSALFRLLAAAPFGEALDRRRRTRAAALAVDISLHLTPALKMLRRLAEMRGFSPTGRVTLEIGAGWNPVYGVLLSLLGARRVILLDIRPYLTYAGFRQVLAQTEPRLPEIAAATGAPADDLRARWRALHDARDLAGLLAAGRLEILAPASASAVPLADGELDLYYSTCVLEHIPEADLPALHRETARLLAPGGLVYHIIDLSDHFAHGDPALPRLNFLRFDDRAWRRLGQNRFFYLNRLRAPDMRRLAEAAGLRTVFLETQVDPADVAFVRGLPLPPRFRGLAPEEIAAGLCHLAAEKL